MSKIYNELKYNVEKLNKLLSQKIVREHFYKSCTWISPMSGEINLYGVGKGKDGYQPEIGKTIYLQGTFSSNFLFAGGDFCYPTTSKYNVIKGAQYEIRLSEIDQDYLDIRISPLLHDSSIFCYFDKKISLGKYLGRRSWNTDLNIPNSIGKTVSFVQKADEKSPYSLEPINGKNGTGVAGVGMEGKAYIKAVFPSGDSHVSVIELVEITKPAGKGGTGFLQISYPYAGEYLGIFDDEYS